MLFSQILNVSNLTSEKKGIPPNIQTASAVEAKVKDGTITASPGFSPSAINPKRRASVHSLNLLFLVLEYIGHD